MAKFVEKCEKCSEDVNLEVKKSFVCTSCRTWNKYPRGKEEKVKPKKGWLS